MAMKLKKIDEQVIVITGASSGIGLATARMALKQGAKVVLAARSANALAEAVAEAGSANAVDVVADVSDRQQVQRIADKAIERFGRIDTWVNDAGLSIYG